MSSGRSPVLRDYQLQVIDEARRVWDQHPVLVCPTGSGKSVIGSAMAAFAVWKGHRPVWTVHRKELVDQAVDHLSRHGLDVGVMVAGKHAGGDEDVIVASTQTLLRRGWPEGRDGLFYDEVHHSAADSFRAFVEPLQSLWWVGLTATPSRLDGRGLGPVGWGALVKGPTVRELQAAGHLAHGKYFAAEPPDLSGVKTVGGDYAKGEAATRMGVLIGDAVAHYEQYLGGRKAILFGTTVKHSQGLQEAFAQRGHPAAHLDAKSPKALREDTVQAFREGDIRVLSNVQLFDEGFDCPDADGVIMARPTRSLVVARQAAGRALRPAPGKEFAVILDMAGNYLRCGLPWDEVEWTLDGKTKTKAPPAGRRCPKCLCVLEPGTSICPECGYEFPRATGKRRIARVDGELVEISSSGEILGPVDERRLKSAYYEMLLVGRARGWKIGASAHKFKEAYGFYPPRDFDYLKTSAMKDCPHTTVEEQRCRFCQRLVGGVWGTSAWGVG